MTRPDPGKFRDAMDAALDKYVKQQGRNTLALNAERDPACVGYARIPGPDACEFCVTMGAANDFYRTLESAGGGAGHGTADDRYHPYCNCEVCLVFRKGGRLVARDPATGEAIDYDGAEMIRRYDEIGRPTFASGHGGGRLSWKQAEKMQRRLESATDEAQLRAIGAEIEAAVPKSARSSSQWEAVRRTARVRLHALRETPVDNSGGGSGKPPSRFTKTGGTGDRDDKLKRIAQDYPSAYKEWRTAASEVRGKKTSQSMRKHVPGTKEFESSELPSYFYVDESASVEDRVEQARAIVDEYAGKGLPLIRENGTWSGKERVTCGNIIGVDGWSNTETRSMTIHYGKSKVHASPRYDGQGRSLG